MRILGMLLLGAGLLVPGLGCNCLCQHIAGVCDCYPPPVETLLVAPSPAHSSLGVYGSLTTTPVLVGQPVPAGIEPVPAMPKMVPVK